MDDGKVRMVFYPGERHEGSLTVGTIYVVNASGRVIDSVQAAGGPDSSGKAQGGHTFEPTPAGHYTLGPKHHHITSGWPNSSIPWGAKLRLSNKSKEVEYEYAPGQWNLATGSNGAVTHAYITFMQRGGNHPDVQLASRTVREGFLDQKTGKLKFETWRKNDFGPWAWNLRKNGQITPYYIHTTPDSEQAASTNGAVFLDNSHGCVHLVPADRDRLVAAGYLKEGTSFEVKPYSEKGPPSETR